MTIFVGLIIKHNAKRPQQGNFGEPLAYYEDIWSYRGTRRLAIQGEKTEFHSFMNLQMKGNGLLLHYYLLHRKIQADTSICSVFPYTQLQKAGGILTKLLRRAHPTPFRLLKLWEDNNKYTQIMKNMQLHVK